MPLYHKTLTVPKDTPKTKPAQIEVEIKERIIISIGLKFPNGCHDMVHVAGYYGIKQLIPIVQGDTVVGDGEVVSTVEWIDVGTVPYKLTFKGWSPETDYKHNILVRIVTLPDVLFTPVKLLNRIMEKLNIWFWRIFRI